MKKYINSSYIENGSDNDYNFGSKALDALDDEHESLVEYIKIKADDTYIEIENLLDHIYEASDDVSDYYNYVLQKIDSIRHFTNVLEDMVTEAVDEYNESI